MKTRHTKVTKSRKSGSAMRASFSIGKFSFSIFNSQFSIRIGRAFSVFIFYLFTFTAGAQVQIIPEANPAVVKMGDSLTFQVQILTQTTPYSDGRLSVTVPQGYRLLPHGFTTFAADSMSAIMSVNVGTSAPATMTFYLIPLCDADIAAPETDRVVRYEFAPSPSAPAMVTGETPTITDFYDPILNVTLPAAVNDAAVNQEYQRVFIVTQTANYSHINNLLVSAVCDRTALDIYKIEVSDDASSWTDITADALDLTLPDRYIYHITRDNTFAPLNYNGKHLGVADTVYIRETLKLKQCSNAPANYDFAFGDGVNFCPSAWNESTNVNYLNPAYGVDYISTDYQSNINYGQEGAFSTKISNNSANPQAWMLKTFVSVYDSRYATISPHRIDSAVLVGADGSTVICKIPMSNSVAMTGKNFASPSSTINLDAHAFRYKIDLEQLPKATTTAMQQAYTDAGLADTDGDGIYSDILPGNSVNLNIYYHYVLENGIVDCSTKRLFDVDIYSHVFWKDRCEQPYAFARSSNAVTSTQVYAIRGGMGGPVTTISKSLLEAGDNAVLTVMMEDANGGLGQHGYPYRDLGNTRIHKVEMTLLVGLDYSGGDIKIRNQDLPATVNATEVSWNASTRTLIFRNTKSMAQPIFYEIPVVATSTVDNAKSLDIKHSFKMKDESTGPHYWSCWETTVPYTQKLPCATLEMVEFSAERTSFGWTDPTNSNRINDTTGVARADRNTPGIDLQAVAPYDNITFVNTIAVNGNVTLNSGDSLMVELTYSHPVAGALFNMPAADPSRMIVLHYKKSGSASYTEAAQFSPTLNSSLITAVNTDPLHTLAVNIASFVGVGKPIAALGAGDSLKVEYLLQTTENIPVAAPAYVAVQAEVYTKHAGVKQACYPRLQSIKVFRDKLYISSPSDDYPNVNIPHEGCFFRWHLGNGTQNIAEVFPNEYRPNAFYKDMTFTIDAVLKINNLFWSRNTANTRTNDYQMTENVDYTVSYSNGSTIITLLTNPLMREAFANYYNGWWLFGSYDIICVAPNKTSITSNSNFQRLDYPTSATTAGYYQHTSATTTFRTGDLTPTRHYQTSVTSPAPIKAASSAVMSWDFAINNNSSFAGSDPYLPNSWVSFESNDGFTPYELYDKTTGVTYPITTSNLYAANKWWVKLDSLRVQSSRNYTIRCTFSNCNGQPAMTITHGFARLVYPVSPSQGFGAPYNSPVCNTKSAVVKMNPVTVDFSGHLEHSPKKPDGTDDFCDVVNFHAEFSNGLSSEVSNLRLVVPLPAGFSYDATTPLQVQLGSGGWTSPASLVATGSQLDVTLFGAGQKLGAYGSPTAKAYVDFRLKISCGVENRQQIYADFIGEGCAVRSKRYSSAPIKIAGVADPADYWIMNLSSPPEPVYTAAPVTVNRDGTFTVSGSYQRNEGPGASDLQAVIELPDNLTLLSQGTGTNYLSFTQTGNLLISTLPKDDGIGANRYFNLTFRPENPHLWTEDTVQISFLTGITQLMTCEILTCDVRSTNLLDSLKFAMQMLEVRYDDNDVAVRSWRNNSTTEHIEIKGLLLNEETSAAFDAGALQMELLTNSSGVYTPVSVAVAGLSVSPLAHGDSRAFTVTADIPAMDNICDMLLVLNKTGAGASNPWLSKSDTLVVPVPVYEIREQPLPICPMSENTSIGEQPITGGYTYSWSPFGFTGNYLSATNTTPVDFTYDYKSTPVADDSVLPYLVTITRPTGCQSVDTVFVPLKGIPSVDNIGLKPVCNGGSLTVSFADATNTNPTGNPTSFRWKVISVSGGTIGGLPAIDAEVTANSINRTLTNNGVAPAQAVIRVIPTKGGCDGQHKDFTVRVYPTPTLSSSLTPAAICSGETFNYTATSATSATTSVAFSWTRAAVAGITPNTGAGNSATVNETLTNTTADPVEVTYRFTLTVNGGQCSNTQEVKVTVKPKPILSSTLTPPAICSGEEFSYNATSATSGTTFSWTRAAITGITPATGNGSSTNISETLTNTTSAPINVTYVFTLTANDCTNTENVTVTVHGKLDGGTIAASRIICHNTKPAAFTSPVAASGGTGATTYTWQWSEDNGITWTDFASSNSETYTHDANLTTTTKYRRRAVNDCGTAVYSNEITVTVRHPSLYDYPDLRIRVCPDGKPVNLSKYVDTLDLPAAPQWSGINISANGVIPASVLNAHNGLLTFTYTVNNPCVGNITRKAYVETLKTGRMRPLKDTIVICYENADAVNINQIFGIDAGKGTWTYFSHSANDIKDYVTESHSSTYDGAVVLNGKALYGSSITAITYHGISAKKAVFTYKPENGSCLSGKSYKIVIILTPDLTK